MNLINRSCRYSASAATCRFSRFKDLSPIGLIAQISSLYDQPLPIIVSPLLIISNLDLVLAQCKISISRSFAALNAGLGPVFEEWLERITTELSQYTADANFQLQPYPLLSESHMNIPQIDTFDQNSFSAPTRNGDAITHNVYSRGDGPVIVIIQELPGIGQETLALADKFVNKGYKVYLPHLFGPIGKFSGLPNFIRVFCMRKEFAIFEKNKSSPIVDWLKALCQEIRSTESVEGVGVIGMCLTGNFAIALMADEAVLAGVASQPALPMKGANLLHMSDDEIASSRARLTKIGPMKAYRFEEDKMSPPERFEAIDKAFNSGDVTCVDLKTLPGKGHSVLTLDFVDEEGHPTTQALGEIMDYFNSKLTAGA